MVAAERLTCPTFRANAHDKSEEIYFWECRVLLSVLTEYLTRIVGGRPETAPSMPTVKLIESYRFFFYSLEGAEPPHIHIERDAASAKFWLDPVQFAGSRGFRNHELNRLRAMVIEHRIAFKEAWDGHFGTEA